MFEFQYCFDFVCSVQNCEASLTYMFCFVGLCVFFELCCVSCLFVCFSCLTRLSCKMSVVQSFVGVVRVSRASPSGMAGVAGPAGLASLARPAGPANPAWPAQPLPQILSLRQPSSAFGNLRSAKLPCCSMLAQTGHICIRAHFHVFSTLLLFCLVGVGY